MMQAYNSYLHADCQRTGYSSLGAAEGLQPAQEAHVLEALESHMSPETVKIRKLNT